MTVKVHMPDGGDEGVDPGAVLVIRNAMDTEKGPGVMTAILVGGTKIFPAEALGELKSKFSSQIKLAELTAPNGMELLVNAGRVMDADPADSSYAAAANTVLVFGTGADAPRQAVRETVDELKQIWAKIGAAPDALA